MEDTLNSAALNEWSAAVSAFVIKHLPVGTYQDAQKDLQDICEKYAKVYDKLNS